MKYKPYDFQRIAIDFIISHPISAVLLDMGMGKTAITLSAIADLMHEKLEVFKVLIIAPLRVARNTWDSEIKKWDHLSGLSYSIAVGSGSKRMEALKKYADIYIINRENVQWLIEKSGLAFDYDMVVIDELSSFKNIRSKRFRSLMKVRPKIKRIVGLTGTPTSNGLIDLFAQYKLLDMGQRLGRFIGRYRQEYFIPDKSNGMVVYSYRLKEGADIKIYEKIKDITISMKNTDHLKMPDLISTTYPVYLSENEMRLYKKLRKQLVLNLGGREITAANAAALSGKLVQMANGAVYMDDGKMTVIHEKKLDALEDMIESANGKPLLVAYWYRHDLKMITDRLTKINVGFQKLDSDESIKAWNEGGLSVGLIHPSAAGHGLNLQDGGSSIVFYGMVWSLELYQQSIGRLWRQGQKDGAVVVQHIVTVGTVDEQIADALAHKRDIETALLKAVKIEVVPDGS